MDADHPENGVLIPCRFTSIFREALGRDPNNIVGLFYYGQTLAALNKTAEAIAQFDSAFTKGPTSEYGARALVEREKLKLVLSRAQEAAAARAAIASFPSRASELIRQRLKACYLTERGALRMCICFRDYEEVAKAISYEVQVRGNSAGTFPDGVRHEETYNVSGRFRSSVVIDSGDQEWIKIVHSNYQIETASGTGHAEWPGNPHEISAEQALVYGWLDFAPDTKDAAPDLFLGMDGESVKIGRSRDATDGHHDDISCPFEPAP